MNTYTHFCLLRDFRVPGQEAPKHTEREAFDRAQAARPSIDTDAFGELLADYAHELEREANDEDRKRVAELYASIIKYITTWANK